MASASLDCTTATFKFVPREDSKKTGGINYVYEVSGYDTTALKHLVSASEQYLNSKKWLETNRPKFSASFFAVSREEEISACITKFLPEDDKEALSKIEQLKRNHKAQVTHYSKLQRREVGGPKDGQPCLRPNVEQTLEFQTTDSSFNRLASRHLVIKKGEEWDFTTGFFVSENYLKSFGPLEGCRVTFLEEENGYSQWLTCPVDDGLFTYREFLKKPSELSIQRSHRDARDLSTLTEDRKRQVVDKVCIGARKGSAWKSLVPKKQDPEA